MKRGREIARQRGAGERARTAVTTCRSASARRPEVRCMRMSITGTATKTSARCSCDQRERLFRVELALEDHRVAEQQARVRVRESPRVEARRGDHHLLAGAVGESFEQRDRGTDVRRARDERTLRRSGRARRHDDRAARACSGGSSGGPARVAVGELVEGAGGVGRRFPARSGPREEPRSDARRGDHRRELLVVHEHDGALRAR